METNTDVVELLFFDTFAHDSTEEINLDLVQFPKPVYVTEVRIIPLGARVQADFPGGVRLGATNPSQFKIEFFVNDLGKPGASTFETLGGFEYNQNGCINLDCVPNERIRKIPTDGLVLRGWYTTITLAVYGTLTKNITEQIIQPVVTPTVQTAAIPVVETPEIQKNTIENEWPSDNIVVPVEYKQTTPATYPQSYAQSENYQQEYPEFFAADAPKDPRNYHHTPETNEWEGQKPSRSRNSDVDRDRERDRNRDPYPKPPNDHAPRSDSDRRSDRDRDKRERSHSYREPRDPDEADWERQPRSRDRGERNRHDDSYRRNYERDERKRPRTPPMLSPKRPRTPHEDIPPPVVDVAENRELQAIVRSPDKEVKSPPSEEVSQETIEEFEPILSDEDILDDPDHFQDDYDYTACTNNDDIIKLFTPGVTPLVKYQKEPIFKVSKEAIEIHEPLKTTIGIVDDYYKSSITKYTVADFEKLNTEIKEEFIHLCEKLIPAIASVDNFKNIMDLYDQTNALSKENLNPSDREMCAQISFIVQTTIDWVKIALNYDIANIQEQPPYKIRHIKCGVRLIEWCCNSSVFINLLWAEHNFNIHETLLGLYNQEFMALSIKLMVLKALDTYLMHKSGMDKFLLGDSENHKENGSKCLNISENNGYKILLECMNKNASVRLKFALSSLMKKVHLYELLYRLHSILIKLRNTTDVSVEEINLMTKILDQVLQFSRNGNFALSQPKRFLPVAAQFEISREEFRNVLVDYFNIFDLLQCFLLLLTYPGTMNLPAVKTPIFEVLESLLESLEGLAFYSNNLETVNFLLKCLLLQTEDEVQFATQNGIDIKSQNLALKIAYKLQAFHHIECLLDLGKKHNFDCGAFEIIDQLHAFFCLTFSPTGKMAVAEILGIKSNFKALLQFLVVRDKSESQLARIKKSPAIGYIIDLIHFAVTTVPNIVLLETYAKDILHIINYQDMFEEAISSKLNEIKAFISPFDNVNTLSHDNISPFVEIIQKELESGTVLSGQLTTSLRILEYLGIPRNSSKSTVLNENPLNNYIELKYKHVILQLYSLDGCSILTKLLQKLCDHYEPPYLSVATFVSSQGLFLANTITPCLQLLKQMLTYVIQCRNTQFRDLTSIPVLLQTYTLMGSFPSSAAAYALAQRNCEIIIEMLLVYTQPVSEEVHEKDSLNKTLWSLMVGEVIKYVTTAPHTFISGLLIFSELLPLPLPIQSSDDMSREEISFAVNLRMLWSAHLHPHSAHIQDVIVKLCTTTHPQLLNLLRRVCVQIADLAANSAIMISRGVLDAVHDAITPKEGVVIPNARAGKLLNFLACLVTHSPIKCAVLHLINSGNPAILKADEKYSTLIDSLTNILKDTSTSNAHVQMQECVLSIIQSFCDSEITLLQNPYNDVKEISSATYLANALPTKDNLVIFVNVLVDHVQNENFFVTYLLAVRTLILLTEHNYGFFYLREHLLKQPGSLCVLLDKLTANFSKVNAVCLSILSTLIEFLRVLLTTEEVEGQLYEPRNIKFKLTEFKSILSWKDDDNENHKLRNLEASLKGIVEEDPTFEAMLEGMTIILRELGAEGEEIKTEMCAEPVLPPPETLLNQFSGRSVYSSVDACDERLTTRYWLAAPNDETDAEIESVTCDLTELCRQSFSLEFNLIREVEKLCKICPSDNITKEKRLDDPKLQKRKPYITPIRTRGFPRTVQQRPDLFRSRPPNTSRPPSLHVDDFVALETCGAQPTGPTGYNKISRELLASTRTSRGSRGRAFASSDRNVHYRQMSWWGSGLGRPPY